MPVQAQRPERCVSTNFTTSAHFLSYEDRPHITATLPTCQPFFTIFLTPKSPLASYIKIWYTLIRKTEYLLLTNQESHLASLPLCVTIGIKVRTGVIMKFHDQNRHCHPEGAQRPRPAVRGTRSVCARHAGGMSALQW